MEASVTLKEDDAVSMESVILANWEESKEQDRTLLSLGLIRHDICRRRN